MGFSHRPSCLYTSHNASVISGISAEVKLRIYALCVHIQRQSNDVHISGTLTVSEQGSLDHGLRPPEYPSLHRRCRSLCHCADAGKEPHSHGTSDARSYTQSGLHIHAAWTSATVLGRLMIALLSAVGCHTSRTALQTSAA